MKKIIIISSLLLTCLASTSCTSSGTEDSIMTIDNTASLAELKTIEIEILELINNYRLTRGLSLLAINDQIRTQTSNHTRYMIAKECASHDNFFSRKQYLVDFANAKRVTENVACGYTNAQSVVNAWLNSETHKLNIEGDYSHFNITAETDKSDKWYFTNIFMKVNN